MPKQLKLADQTHSFATTDSPDGVKPPTHVTLYMPIDNALESYIRGIGSPVVQVEFTHPAGKIITMNLTRILVN